MQRLGRIRALILITTVVPLWGSGVARVQAAPRCFGKPATIIGTKKSDSILGTSKNDVILALGGNDLVKAEGGDDRVCGGDGHDQDLFGGPGRDRISGGSKLDIVDGGPGRDLLKGGAGWDSLYGSSDRDVLRGGAGGDDLGGGSAEDLLIGGSGDDNLADLNRDEGNDTALGGTGDDRLGHSAGNDYLDGGPGFDSASSFVLGTSGATIDLAAGTAGVGDEVATLVNIEGAIGTDLADVLIGNDADNYFLPIYGDDTIDGRGGRDLVNFDRFEDSPVPGLTIDLAAGTAEGAGNDTLSSIEDVLGSEGPDVIRGDAGPNRLFGGYGDDHLEGRDGDDILDGDFLTQPYHSDEDTADGGAHVAGDVCVDVAQSMGCESSTPPDTGRLSRGITMGTSETRSRDLRPLGVRTPRDTVLRPLHVAVTGDDGRSTQRELPQGDR